MKRKRPRTFSLATAAVLLLPVGCTSPRAPSVIPSPAKAGLIHRGVLEDRFLLTGELHAVRSLSLTAPRTRTWNIALQWLAEEGSQVKAGDPVAQLDSSSILTGLEDQRQALLEAELQLQKTRSEMEIQRLQKSLELLRKRTERDKARLEADIPEALRSPRDFQEKQLALQKAEAALAKAERELSASGQQEETQLGVLSIQRDKARRLVRRAEESLGALTLRAPHPGILIYSKHPWQERKWKVGDMLQPDMPVVELPDLSEMYVEARLSDLDDGEAAPGMPARCRLDALPDRIFPGRVGSVDAAAEEKVSSRGSVRSFRVRVDLEQSDPRVMRPGMSAKVEVIRRRLEDRLLVPRALLDLAASPPKFRWKDGRELKVEVEACGALECALRGDPAPIVALAKSP